MSIISLLTFFDVTKFFTS